MKLTAFQSDKGDCLLLETADGKNRMLVDGGMRRAYSEHVAPALGKLREAKKKIDIAYISHIDQDHISGVLRLLDDEAAWRVHLFQVSNGNPKHPRPDSPRPPEVGRIFHNSFHDMVGENTGPIEDMLAATAEILSGADHPWLREIAADRRNIVASIPEALRVSNRIQGGQLNIPLNPEFKGKLMMVDEDMSPVRLGSIRLKVIGPFPKDLKALRKQWNSWLEKNEKKVKAVRSEARADEKSITAGDAGALLGPMMRAAALLGESELALAKELGNRKKVTTPNLASLMFLAEENGQTVLLTGDGHWEDILKGLEYHQAFDAEGLLHVDVLKVQHHGGEYNIAKPFCDRVTADCYVFSGNGEHENPDLDVLQLIFDRRMANDSRPFRFLFNSNSKVSIKQEGREHMMSVEKLIAKLEEKSQGRLKAQFITGSSMRVL